MLNGMRCGCLGAFKDASGEWLDCIEANSQGLRNLSVPLCPRCKVKARLDELTITLPKGPA
jgi:hypothetical protein